MKRSNWKLPFIDPLIYKNCLNKRKRILLKARNLLVTRSLLKKTINIHNGLFYKSKTLVKANLGHKVGEFSFTRKCSSDVHMLKKLRKKIKSKKK